jgi:hypothetical protein
MYADDFTELLVLIREMDYNVLACIYKRQPEVRNPIEMGRKP